MNFKKLKRVFVKLFFTAFAATIIIGILFSVARYNARSMGFETDEEGLEFERLVESGIDPQEAFHQINEGHSQGSDNTQPTEQPAEQPQTPATTTTTPAATTTTEPKKEEVKKETAPAKVFSHDFDTITDEAKENFIYFSQDGTEDSMYLNITTGSAFNTLTGKELNATKSGGEVGRVNYVSSSGEAEFTWIFENFETSDDYMIDLSAYLEHYTSESLPANSAAFYLDVAEQDVPLGNTVTLKVKTPFLTDAELNILAVNEDGSFAPVSKQMTEEGYITLTFEKKIVPYVISIDDLSELTKNSDEATEEVSVEESVSETSEKVTDSVSEVVEAPAEVVLVEEVKTGNGNYGIIIAIIAAVVLLGTAILVSVKKKKK